MNEKEINELLEETKNSQCANCGSHSYGYGCPYSSYKKLHIHLDDPTACSFCGSKKIYGPGCVYSPSHNHGISSNLFTQMKAESFITGYLIHKLKSNVELEKPLSILESYILKLKKLLGSKLDLVNETFLLNNLNKILNESNLSQEEMIKSYKSEIILKNKVKDILNTLNEEILKSKIEENISNSTIEKIIIESFMELK